MAERPIFVPSAKGSLLVQTKWVTFTWSPGLSTSQKRKNIASLHAAAALSGLGPLLEISSKSELPLGQELSSFNLQMRVGDVQTTVECAYQGSKVFKRGGPYHDLYVKTSREAKKDPRLSSSGGIVGFRMDGEDYSSMPETAFYDWLYVNAVARRRAYFAALETYAGFTDIEFNAQRSLNCQARSCAMYVALVRRGELEVALQSFGEFIGFLPMVPAVTKP